MYADELDPVELAWLSRGYMRRVQFESKVLLAAISETLNGKSQQRVPPDLMLAQLEGRL